MARFREALLSITLQHAWRHSPHYRRVLPASVREGKFPLACLHELPILTKAEHVENNKALQTSGEPGVVQCTTGTTGAPIYVYRTEGEIEFLREFQSAVQTILRGDRPGPRPLTLGLASAYHGRVVDMPTDGYVMATGLFDAVQLDQASRWLVMEHAIPGVAPRVTRITGVYNMVQWLTYMLHDRGFDFSQARVEQIYLVGGHVTARWLDLLKRLWGAILIPVYSLTEVFTYANRCVECGAYHFLPNVIPELLNPVDHGPLTGDVGELVLTGLYPFTQGQPAIRYATRDLFRIEQGRCGHGEGYHFLGRVDHSWILPLAGRPPLVLGSADVQDALDAMGELARTPALRGLPGMHGGDEIGRPRCLVELDTGGGGVARLRVTAELRFPPILYPESAARCQHALEAHLRGRVHGLDRALRDGCLALEVRCAETSADEGRSLSSTPWERSMPPENGHMVARECAP